jgi:uncharacterized protein with GYD domain
MRALASISRVRIVTVASLPQRAINPHVPCHRLVDRVSPRADTRRVRGRLEGAYVMQKYAIFFNLKGETVRAMMERPSDRAEVVAKMCESAGGRMESYYFMFGAWDGFVIAEIPDSKAAAAMSLAVSSSGAFAQVETHELVEAGDLQDILGRSASLAYTPPGS